MYRHWFEKIFSIKKFETHCCITFFMLKIKIKNKNRDKNKQVYSINERIKQAKYVHIMFNDKFNKPYVDFLNRNFNQKEHLVLCKRFYDCYPFPDGENVVEIESLNGLKFDDIDKLICHSLFDKELVKYLYKHPDILKEKAHWVIWGGDLYNAKRNKINDYVRQNCKGYIACIAGDELLAKNKYNSNSDLYSAPYPDPITKQMLDEVNPNKTNEYIIQINNSCDRTILEMLDILSKFKDENIKITTILSYGRKKYKKDIIKKGQKIFKDKFEYLDKFMNPTAFTQYLSNVNVLVFNQDRQQGAGNALIAASLGVKLFIKEGITTVKYLKDHGIKTFNTYDIKNMSFEDFIHFDKDENEINSKNAKNFFDDAYVVKAYEKFFN